MILFHVYQDRHYCQQYLVFILCLLFPRTNYAYELPVRDKVDGRVKEELATSACSEKGIFNHLSFTIAFIKKLAFFQLFQHIW